MFGKKKKRIQELEKKVEELTDENINLHFEIERLGQPPVFEIQKNVETLSSMYVVDAEYEMDIPMEYIKNRLVNGFIDYIKENMAVIKECDYMDMKTYYRARLQIVKENK